MAVVSFLEYANRDMLAVIERVREAVLAGELNGLALCIRYRGGREKVALTGVYATGDAAEAAQRLSEQLSKKPPKRPCCKLPP